MKPSLTLSLALLAMCFCSCRKHVIVMPSVATSPVCSSADLISLSNELRNLASNETISSAALYAYLERDRNAHWKIDNDCSSFDTDYLTYTSIEWEGVEVWAKYYVDSAPDSGQGRIGTISDLDIVVNDVSKPARKMLITIMRDELLCW